MLRLDHITLIAPSLAEGAAHVEAALGIAVPFGTRHLYMGSHNHRLQLGRGTYLEIVALDPEGASPGRARWFGLDDRAQVRADWDAGRRLRGWVAATEDMAATIAAHPGVFGREIGLPFDAPEFGFSIPDDGSLPLGGAAPSLIDHRGDPTSMADIPDLGARLTSLTVETPDPASLAALYADLDVDRPIGVVEGSRLRYVAEIEVAGEVRTLT
ncbi:MAG: VOC family protein [Pseudomonadota bacterium]